MNIDGGDIRCRSREPKPEASPSCLVFLLKGQRPVIAHAGRFWWLWRLVCAAVVWRVCLIKALPGGRWPLAAQRGHRGVGHWWPAQMARRGINASLTMRYTRPKWRHRLASTAVEKTGHAVWLPCGLGADTKRCARTTHLSALTRSHIWTRNGLAVPRLSV
jgi:hypothetical protein